jgi:dTDP-4-dehydrorhamnose reductase
MDKILVFGASGLLGASLVPALRAFGYQVLAQGRNAKNDLCLDPFSQDAIVDALEHYLPNTVVNLIAETNVDLCESEPQLAWRANASVVKNLVESIKIVNQQTGSTPHLVHISTDQLYDGLGPHIEEHVDPMNVYGLSKYAGELIAQQMHATVLRTNFFGKSRCAGRVSFTDWLYSKLSLSEPITVFDDVKFSALHIDTLCQVIAQCIEQKPVGVFNVGSRDALSKAEFAKSFAKIMNLPFDQVMVGSSGDIVLKARRPKDMSLNVSRLEGAIGFQLPLIHDEINYAAKEYRNDG